MEKRGFPEKKRQSTAVAATLAAVVTCYDEKTHCCQMIVCVVTKKLKINKAKSRFQRGNILFLLF